MHDIEKIVVTHFDKLAQNYSCYCQKRSPYLGSIESIVASKIESINSHPLEILDIGCGNGDRAKRIQSLLSENRNKWIGIDISKNMLNFANLSKSHHILKQTHVSSLPFSNDEFDVIIALFNVIGYIFPTEQRIKALHELFRVLRPEGKFLVDVLNIMHVRDNSFRLSVVKQILRVIHSLISNGCEIGDLFFSISLDNQQIEGAVHAFFPPFFLKSLRNCGFRIVSKCYIGYGSGLVNHSLYRGHLFVEVTK